MWVVFGESLSVCVCEHASFGPPVFNINHPFQFLFPTTHSGGFSKIVHLHELRCAAELFALELITTGCISSIFNVSKHPMELQPLLRKTA